MHILVTGATGFIGTRLCERLLEAGHRLSALSRDPCGAERAFRQRLHAVDSPTELAADVPLDAVINLAGAPLPGRRWSEAYKQELRDSRIALTAHLAEQLDQRGLRPSIWLNGSAIGYYGDCGEETVGEEHEPGSDFAAWLCRDWEDVARAAARRFDARLGIVRTGIVLGPGGALAAMRPAFALGLGGPLGHGRQFMSWIHREDLVGLFLHLLKRDDLSGPFNGTAPHPVSNREFAQNLGRLLRRPALLPMPGFALRLLVGEMAELLLTGQKVMPVATLDSGFLFRYRELDGALRAALEELSG